MRLQTDRLTLTQWTDNLRDPFARMNAHPEVMADLGGPFPREKSDAKFDRYRQAFVDHSISRWAILDANDRFHGYAGIMPVTGVHPLGDHYEIGWRLCRKSWGKGFAVEAAKASLEDARARLKLMDILSYTSATNTRSQAVMGRLGLNRDPASDFTHQYGAMSWTGLVWKTASRQSV